ncbi:hypothetical protein [Candidatus Leptofilum sp.]|uniref:hypothetical protein n=1 Tax=Candidatus Leptofilum sp. TaxID=3241576 RepID=UPI003B5A6D89
MTMMPQEQQVRQLVRETLTQVGQIENGRLTQLMPAIPKKKRPFWQNWLAQPLAGQLAIAAMLFVLLLGGWHWVNNGSNAVWQALPTSVAVTATTTNTPTATQTQTRVMVTETAVSQQPAPAIVQTPAPLPTPVAAVPINQILSN